MQKWALLGLALTMACGGTTVIDPPLDGGGDAKPKSDSGVGFPSDGGDGGTNYVVNVPCPSSPPAEGSACTQLSEQCEYGSNFFSTCNTIYRCDPQSQTWIKEPLDNSTCSTTQACPAQYSDATGACTNSWIGCQYPQGFCECHGYCGGPPDNQQGMSWDCVPGTQACPAPRPDLGTPCTQEGQSCDYMICCSGTTMTCANGVWQGQVLNQPCQ